MSAPHLSSSAQQGRPGASGGLGGFDDGAPLEAYEDDGWQDDGDFFDSSPARPHFDALARALKWNERNKGGALLARVVETRASVPLGSEAEVMERMRLLGKQASQAVAGLRRVLPFVTLAAIAAATLFVEPLAVLEDEALLDVLFYDYGVALAWLHAEHVARRELAAAMDETTEREQCAQGSRHLGQIPSAWVRKPKDLSLDLGTCSLGSPAKAPKYLIDTQKLLRALSVGAEEAIADVARDGGERAVEVLVEALHKIATLVKAGAVTNAEALLSSVTAVSAVEYNVEARIKVDKALTAAERLDADKKAELKSKSDLIASNKKIAQALDRPAPPSKWGSGGASKSASGADGSGVTREKNAGPKGAHKYGKDAAAAKASTKSGSTAPAAAAKAADKSAKSPATNDEGDDAQ